MAENAVSGFQARLMGIMKPFQLSVQLRTLSIYFTLELDLVSHVI